MNEPVKITIRPIFELVIGEERIAFILSTESYQTIYRLEGNIAYRDELAQTFETEAAKHLLKHAVSTGGQR